MTAKDTDGLDKASADWIAEQEQVMDEGRDMVKKASDEALDYIRDAIENMGDKAWRKMVVSTQALEMGAGIALAEHLVPAIYHDMEKNLHKKLKLSKNTARALRHIYIGRVVKNIRKELNNNERNR